MIPHRCPVCEGCGSVQPGFYGWDIQETPCRSCNGTGVLWREREPSQQPMAMVGSMVVLDTHELVLLP